jgi:hypothetical protein
MNEPSMADLGNCDICQEPMGRNGYMVRTGEYDTVLHGPYVKIVCSLECVEKVQLYDPRG